MLFSFRASRTSSIRNHHRQGLVGLLVASALLSLAPVASAASDSSAPTVKVTAPYDGSTVAGMVTLTASASDNVGVVEVRWYIDGAEVAKDLAAKWSRTWNART